ncbi:ABC transporter ATP-binding protein [Bauldia litoralis]|uniref:ABC transporter ATP-binding protein n=2 Tax=Hyphomicrobiales TaxID=356 RepID=UPI0032663CAF
MNQDAESVTIRGIEKSFGRTKVLRGVDLAIERREFVILLGPSGCGKTTLLRIIAGLERAEAGEIRIGERRVDQLEPKERNVAMVFQSYALYPHMNVFNNQSFSLRLRRMAKDDIRDRVNRAAKTLGLEQLLERYPRELSGGQRQRVSMGRAIVRSPKVFLFDEPLSNLDAQLRVHMRGEIKDLHHQLDTTSVYVTHDQVEAMTMGDRIVVMNGGIIEQIGSPLEVFDKPKNRFVAGFVGSPAMNFVDGELTTSGSGLELRVAGRANIPLGEAGVGRTSGRATIGIRPHHLRITADGPMRSLVKDVQPTGVETILLCRWADSEMLVQTTDRVGVPAGQEIGLSVDPADIHLFDSETGERLDV